MKKSFWTLALLGLAQGGVARAEPAAASPALELRAAYTAELWTNLRGGLARDTAYLDNLDLAAELDLERALGMSGTTILVSGLHNNRSVFSETIVGDIQTISNIDTDGSLRLYEAWLEQALGKLTVKAGLIDLNSELDAIETASLFINSSHGIGPDFAQAGVNGPSIFPITGLGIVGRIDLASNFDLRAAVFEGTPGNVVRPRRMRLELEDEGVLLAGEVGYRPSPSIRIAAGVWRHTDQERLLNGDKGRVAGGVYASIDANLHETARHSLSAFARVGFADEDIYQVSSYQGAGLVLSGPILGAQDEQLGIAVASARNGAPIRNVQDIAGASVDARETAVELTYGVQIAPFLSLQPDIQYIVNPAMNPALKDALAVGLRTEWSWGNASE